MTPETALRQGFSLARRTRAAVWPLFLVNLGLAALAALPIYQGILDFTGHSLVSETLRFGFSVDWLTDFSFNNRGALDRYAHTILLYGLLSIPINTILAGGVLARFQAMEQSFSIGEFIRDVRRFAWRLLRLMALGLIGYWIIFRLLNQSLDSHVSDWTREWGNDRSIYSLHLMVGILVLAGLIFVNLTMDYARVKLVLEDGSSAIEAFLASLGFSVRRLAKTFTVYAIPSLCGIGLMALAGLAYPVIRELTFVALSVLSHWPRAVEALGLALLFIGQQIVIFLRYWFRVATWASEWRYYSGSRS